MPRDWVGLSAPADGQHDYGNFRINELCSEGLLASDPTLDLMNPAGRMIACISITEQRIVAAASISRGGGVCRTCWSWNFPNPTTKRNHPPLATIPPRGRGVSRAASAMQALRELSPPRRDLALLTQPPWRRASRRSFGSRIRPRRRSRKGRGKSSGGVSMDGDDDHYDTDEAEKHYRIFPHEKVASEMERSPLQRQATETIVRLPTDSRLLLAPRGSAADDDEWNNRAYDLAPLARWWTAPTAPVRDHPASQNVLDTRGILVIEAAINNHSRVDDDEHGGGGGVDDYESHNNAAATADHRRRSFTRRSRSSKERKAQKRQSKRKGSHSLRGVVEEANKTHQLFAGGAAGDGEESGSDSVAPAPQRRSSNLEQRHPWWHSREL